MPADLTEKVVVLMCRVELQEMAEGDVERHNSIC